jgi:Rps23 Pro-64 3,4-dihydroxylase Tpa1-like proline 4-hydroxylase
MTEKSQKWDYHLNFKHIYEKNFLKISELLLKKHGLDKIFKLSRSYASANTYGFSGEYHTDDGAKEYNEIITIMFYLNNNWSLDYGGETFFLNHEKSEIEYAVIPKPARAVLFDGFIYHGPRPLSKFCNELRMVLTFKYELINK